MAILVKENAQQELNIGLHESAPLISHFKLCYACYHKARKGMGFSGRMDYSAFPVYGRQTDDAQ